MRQDMGPDEARRDRLVERASEQRHEGTLLERNESRLHRQHVLHQNVGHPGQQEVHQDALVIDIRAMSRCQ